MEFLNLLIVVLATLLVVAASAVFKRRNKLQRMPSKIPAQAAQVSEVNSSVYELYSPQGEPSMEVIFFHGFQRGHYKNAHLATWKCRDGSDCIWPQTWLVEEFSNARILSVSYNASILKHRKSGPFDMYIVSENLISDLLDANIGQGHRRPVVLVGHSFGGLVIKQLCCDASRETGALKQNAQRRLKLISFLENIRGIFFYSTPHRGIAAGIAEQFVPQGPLLEYVKVLSTPAARLNFHFDNLCGQDGRYNMWHIAGVGENLPTKSGGFHRLVATVPEASSRYGARFNIVEEADHISVCRPTKKSSRSFLALTEFFSSVEHSKAQENEESRKNDQKLRRQVGEWLSPVSSDDDFKAFSDRLRPSTCEWIFPKPDFSCWMENNTDPNNPPLFWISGIPGAGKSYLATRIIQQLRELYPVAFFYCDSKNEQKRSVLNVLRTWAWQLLQQLPGCLSQIAEIYSKGARPSVANMREALELLAKSSEIGCRLVLDGLDECDPAARSELLNSILPEILGHSRVLIVSRHENDISSGISKCGKDSGFKSLRISEADNGHDIIGYLQEAVADMCLDHEALEQRVLSSLQQSARGMFLWARLMIEDLSVPGRTIEEYEAALLDLPEGLDELYGRVLNNLHSNFATRERSQQLFQWLACAVRPLTIGELKAALTIVVDEEHIEPKKVIRNLKATLWQCCGPLIDIDDAPNGAVSLIHTSVKDFLLSSPGGSPTSGPTYSSLFVESTIAHVYIARACLTYLCSNEIALVDVNEDLETSLHKIDAHLGTWEFLNYATLNWYIHLNLCITSAEARGSFRRLYSSQYNTVKWLQLINRLQGGKQASHSEIDFLKTFHSAILLDDHDTVYQHWLEHLDGPPTGRFSRWQRFMHWAFVLCTPALHISAHFDFDALANKIIQEGGFVDHRDNNGRTALHHAAHGDAVEVTKILLRAGASIDARCKWDTSALMYAVVWEQDLREFEFRSGTFEVASFLIESGADVCYVKSNLRTALTYACKIPRHEDEHILNLVTLMLEHGAKKIINLGQEDVPIGLAAHNNSFGLVRTLLQYGAYVDAEPSNARKKEMLMRYGTYAHKRNEEMLSTPLVRVCRRKNCAAIPLLIEAGANVHARDYDGRTSLHNTARVNSYDASRRLLDCGADVNAVAWSDGSTPIHDAIRENHITQMELFVNYNAELEIEDSSGRTPLDIALDNNCIEAVSLLLKAGANPNRKDKVLESNEKRLTRSDLCHVYWILRRGLKRPLPPSIVTKITTLAEYWIKSEESRSDYLVVTEKEVGPAYIKSRPIQGRVQRIVFTFESHDQGDSLQTEQHGTYYDCHSWFQVEIWDAQGLPVAVDGHERIIQYNVHASKVRRKHMVVYGHGRHMRKARWFEQLKRGDVVGIVPYARYPGWENHVYAVSLLIEAGANPNRKDRVFESNEKRLTRSDLCHVYWILRTGLKRPLPPSIVTKITTLAEYWIKSEESRSDYLVVTEKEVGPAYIKSRPIQGRVQRIVFTFESHDQGDSWQTEQHGTYYDCHSWFQVEIWDAQGLPVVVDVDERIIQYNVHASKVRRKHMVVYGHGQHMRKARWFEQLKRGDVVGIVPYARYPGWENHVYAVSLLIEAGANPNRKDTVLESNEKRLTRSDLCHVYWILRRGLKRPLPPSIVTKITTLAEYWIKSEESRSDYLMVTEKVVGPVYIKSRPIQGCVQRIVFTFESHDQGDSLQTEQHGTYYDCHSWFQVEIWDAQGLRVAVDGHERIIQYNVHASKVRRKHMVVYGHGRHMRKARWFEQLKQGDVVGVVPYARYPGWENHVYAVKIEIYYN